MEAPGDVGAEGPPADVTLARDPVVGPNATRLSARRPVEIGLAAGHGGDEMIAQ